MWKRLVSIGVVVAFGALPAVGQVRVWDNFDSYGSGTIPDDGAFQAVWPPAPIQDPFSPVPVGSMVLEDATFRGASLPFSVKYHKCVPEGNIRDLTAIAEALDPAMNGFNGTDENPLHLHVYFDLQTVGKEHQTHFFVELFGLDPETCEDSPAPILMPNPNWDPGNPESPQYIDMKLTYTGTPPSCDVTNETPSVPRSAIAFGFAGGGAITEECPGTQGFMPKPPCDVPRSMEYSVLYNGDRWYVLDAASPGSGDEIHISKRRNKLDMYIKTDTIDITVDTNEEFGGLTVHSRTGIPRTYLGGFTAIGLGSRNESHYPGWVDDVLLEDGVLAYVSCAPATGACCRADGTCEDGVEEADCTGYVTWHRRQACADILCCPMPFADSDGDLDVDQFDFGVWQACFTGASGGVNPGCECYDRDDSTGAQGGDGDVDATDFQWFANCFTGPALPMDLGDPPTDCVP